MALGLALREAQRDGASTEALRDAGALAAYAAAQMRMAGADPRAGSAALRETFPMMSPEGLLVALVEAGAAQRAQLEALAEVLQVDASACGLEELGALLLSAARALRTLNERAVSP